MTDVIAPLRRDLEFYPVQLQGKQLILVRDHLGLVPDGRALEIALYQLMVLLDGTTTVRDLQMALMRQRGGTLVSSDEIESVIASLDDSFLLESKKLEEARNRVREEFVSQRIRPSSHSGRAFPADPAELERRLDEILSLQAVPQKPKGELLALVAPHIDLSIGARIYSMAYQGLRGLTPKTVIILGTGHQMGRDLFAISDKDFETPLGIAESDRTSVEKLRVTGGTAVARDDFAHKTEHSIEFQVLFLQHILPKDSFTIVPVLCGNLQTNLLEYSRQAYREKAEGVLQALSDILGHSGRQSLLIAGVDFSHIGPKFGHQMPAQYLMGESEIHDRALLEALSQLNADLFWEESRKVKDAYNVCGFSALACLLEVLPSCRGQLLGYEIWHEEATRSAVSFAAMTLAV